MSLASNGDVAILLCTFDGARFLPAQLESIRGQTFRDWRIVASDDGSRDDTMAILAAFREAVPGTQVLDGPRLGFRRNFLSLVSSPLADADHVAFCDQDDVWNDDKLERALRALAIVPAGVPALYCSRTTLIDDAGRVIGASPLFRRPPSFRNALTQNIAGGNTMVLNRAARDILRAAGDSVEVPSHDWWAYIAVTAAGGHVIYDPVPSIAYRQHGGNTIGGGRRRTVANRIARTFSGANVRAFDAHRAALARIANLITPENRRVLQHLARYREAPWPSHVLHFRRAGLYRQSAASGVGLIAAALVRRF
jgi:glycosyltransferase involved in cell wall biosynthesis